MEVESVTYNWHQSGSTMDRDGCGDNWTKVEVGKNGVTQIDENIPRNGMEVWNYLVHRDGVPSFRIFNPNLVTYKS